LVRYTETPRQIAFRDMLATQPSSAVTQMRVFFKSAELHVSDSMGCPLREGNTRD
jgi:hypothetical protein